MSCSSPEGVALQRARRRRAASGPRHPGVSPPSLYFEGPPLPGRDEAPAPPPRRPGPHRGGRNSSSGGESWCSRARSRPSPSRAPGQRARCSGADVFVAPTAHTHDRQRTRATALIALAAGACAALPWIVVVGSLAYNRPMMLARSSPARCSARACPPANNGGKPLQQAMLVSLPHPAARAASNPPPMLLCVPPPAWCSSPAPGRIGTRLSAYNAPRRFRRRALHHLPVAHPKPTRPGQPCLPFAAGLFGSTRGAGATRDLPAQPR